VTSRRAAPKPAAQAGYQLFRPIRRRAGYTCHRYHISTACKHCVTEAFIFMNRGTWPMTLRLAARLPGFGVRPSPSRCGSHSRVACISIEQISQGFAEGGYQETWWKFSEQLFPGEFDYLSATGQTHINCR
jgi:hypothetical protein